MKGSEETRSDASFQCEICHKNFKRKESLNLHITSVHEGKKPFKCEICEYKCSMNQQMKLHVTKKHRGNKI